MANLFTNIQYNNYKKLVNRPEILGMTSEYELAFLQYYTMNKYGGYGEIVDMGCWLGATTLYLAKGLQLNNTVKNKEKRIHAFDLFEWNQYLDGHVKGTIYEDRFKSGDDYKWLFLENTRNFEKNIVVRGNINNEIWDGKPIEFLFIDAMKDILTTHNIIKNYFPFLISNKSLLVYQDFDHYLTPWIHLLIYRFRDYFKHLVDITPFGSTVFKLIRPIPDHRLKIDVTLIDENEADNAFCYCLKIASKGKRANIAAAHVMYYYYHKKIDKAIKLHAKYLDQGLNPNSDLKLVEHLLKNLHD